METEEKLDTSLEPTCRSGLGEPSNGDIDAQLAELNRIAIAELSLEEEKVKKTLARLLEDGQYVDALSPGMNLAKSKRPGPSTKGVAAGIFAYMVPKPPPHASSVLRQGLWGAVFGAVTQLALGFGEVIAAPPEQRTVIFAKLVKHACIAAIASGAAAALAKTIEQWLVKNGSRIIAVLCSRENAEKLAFKIVRMQQSIDP
jgi:hypothetical protein